jgi:hypothetical protein
MFMSVHEPGQVQEGAATCGCEVARQAQVQKLLLEMHNQLDEEAMRDGARQPCSVDLSHVKRRPTCTG